MVPIEGLNHMLSVTVKNGTPVPQWYIGLFEGDYSPDASATAATLPALATECTAYSETTRVPLTTGAVSGGATSNAANIAEFTFPVAKTVYGAFITSAPAKGAATGTLLSVVRFPSPRVMGAGSVLRVFAGPTGASLS